MKIIVCAKQVPSTNEVRLDPINHTIIRDSKASVINPFDSHALEEAVKIKEKLGGSITVLSMGIPATEVILRDCLSRGADQALLLSDRAFAGADTLATSYVLSLGVQKQGDFDLIICGKMAVDGDTAQIGPELAETLNISHICDVKQILAINKKTVRCLKITDYGEQEIEVALPALLTVIKEINMPRLPSISGIKKSLISDCLVWDAGHLQADIARCGLNGSPTQVVKTFTPERKQQATTLEGNPKEQVAAMAAIIKEVLA